MTNIQEHLFSMQDLKFREFHSKLCPTLDKDIIIGVRTPQLRAYAKELVKSGEAKRFLEQLPHTYFEENQLHSFIISEMKNYDEVMKRLEVFLPFIDNWATCDQLSPKVFKKNRDKLIQEIPKWMQSEDSYIIRFGVGMLMQHYLDDEFQDEYLEWVAGIKSEEYYVNMMLAWYYATALAKQWDVTLPYIEERKLCPWVHGKAIQKAVESRRISNDRKKLLRQLRL